MNSSVKTEVVPRYVTSLADAYEQGKIVIGGHRSGKTWAIRMAAAKPLQKQLPHK